MRKYFLILMISTCLLADFSMQDMEKEIRLQITDSYDDTANRHWTQDELYRRIELAQNEIIRKSGCLETRSTITLSTGVGEYALASNCLEVRSVEYSTTTTYPLIFLSKRKLATMKKTWKDDTGKPTNWTNILFSSGIITIYPKPSSAYGGTIVTYYYIQKVSSYTTYSGSSNIFEGRPALQPYYTLVVFYVARLCMVDNRNWEYANNFKALYDEGLILLINELNSSTVERTLRRQK